MCTSRIQRILSVIVGSVAVVGSFLKLYTNHLIRQAETRYPPLGHFVTVDDIRLHYIRKGVGRPVVLIHGDGGSVYDWTLSVFDRVAEQYHAVAFDRPGFGYSERPRDGASPLVQARLLHHAITALGITKPVLVGHSRGGIIVTAYALQYPETIAGVITLGGGIFHAGGWTPPLNKILLIPVVGRLLAHTVYVPFGRRAVEAGLRHVFSPDMPAPPAYVAAYAALVLRPAQMTALADDQVNSAPDMHRMIPGYEELRVPLVIINGQEDTSTPIEDVRKFHRIVQTSQLVEVPNSGHETMFTHPDIVLRAIQTVFERSDAHTHSTTTM